MISTLSTLHMIISILLVISVLFQFGKGAETGLMDAASQGASFGPRGNILSKITTVLAVIFLGLAVTLARLRSDHSKNALFDDSTAPKSRPLNSDAMVDKSKQAEEAKAKVNSKKVDKKVDKKK